MRRNILSLLAITFFCQFMFGQAAYTELTESWVRERRDINTELLKSYSADRLLHNFRANAGIKSDAQPLEGWEAPYIGLRGHFTGHYLSAISHLAGQSGDKELADRIKYMVSALGECQKALGDGYLSAFPSSEFDKLEKGNFSVWAPYYTYQKIMQGLLDAYLNTGNRQAYDIVLGMAAYIGKRMSLLDGQAIEKMLYTTQANPANEPGAMNEVLWRLYAVSHDPNHRKLAEIFDREWFVKPLEENRDILSGLHSNTHIALVTGFAQRYNTTHEQRYFDVVSNFWDMLTSDHAYANGTSSGPRSVAATPTSKTAEHWADAGCLSTTLTTGIGESCVTHNTQELSAQLFAWTKNAKYADSFMNTFYNGVMASHNPHDGANTYHLPLGQAQKKEFLKDNDFRCCNGSSVEAFASVESGIYCQEGSDLWVNLYVPSKYHFKDNAFVLEQQGNFPADYEIGFTVSASKKKDLNIHLLVPSWCSKAHVYVNGMEQESDATPMSYITLSRKWKDGDRIKLVLDPQYHYTAMPDNGYMAAFFHGATMLAFLTDSAVVLEGSYDQILAGFSNNSDGSFKLVNRGREYSLMPFYQVTDGTYTVYANISSIWNLPPLDVEQGPYTEDWDSLSRRYNVPQWWRDAKFGAWSHWDPQSAAEYGDWYSRGMYMPRNEQYRYHLEHYGHPSEYGYKDLCNDWNIDLWNPDSLMQLYIGMGARYFVAMGNHHDNFDCWDSEYQPWNSVNVGPKKDIVGIWKETAAKYDMPFGIGFHATPARTYGQFMTVRYTSDRSGQYAGVPYDAFLTARDGNGKWWEGLDPMDLYGPEHHDGRNSLETPFANQFLWRVDDAIRKYQPDMIYFDDHAGDSQIDLGVNMGLGRLTPQILANFYNIAAARTDGRRDVVATFKGVGGRYDSFQNSPHLLPLVDRSLVKSTEFYTEDRIMAFPFQTELSMQEWHFKPGAPYHSASDIIQRLMENVSRNGSLLLNITQRGRGDIEPEARRICEDIGRWLQVNGPAVYGSRPFCVWGDEHFIFTRNNSRIYVTMLDWNGAETTIGQLSTACPSVGKITGVRILGDDTKVRFRQDERGLTVQSQPLKPYDGIVDEKLAAGYKVLEITHTKAWFNDDDPSVQTIGWDRKANLETGDYNNDLYLTDVEGDSWKATFNGRRVTLVSPVGPEYGRMRILIDGVECATVNLGASHDRKAQQQVFTSDRLTKGQHTIEIISLQGLAAIDALIFTGTGK